jgi:hypothetical protein
MGFVYIWLDKKYYRFYIGSHWGPEDDGYICSSPWMKRSYRKRPESFKRRILARVNTNRYDLLNEEYRWIKMIKKEELGKRYYNLKNCNKNYWWLDTASAQGIEVRKKISNSKIGKKRSKQTLDKIRKTLAKKQSKSPKIQKFWFNDGFRNYFVITPLPNWAKGRLKSRTPKKPRHRSYKRLHQRRKELDIIEKRLKDQRRIHRQRKKIHEHHQAVADKHKFCAT